MKTALFSTSDNSGTLKTVLKANWNNTERSIVDKIFGATEKSQHQACSDYEKGYNQGSAQRIADELAKQNDDDDD